MSLKQEEEKVEKNYLLNGSKDRSQWSFFVINRWRHDDF